MSAQKDCEFLVKRARELVSEDPCAAKAWLITARTLYPADFNIQVILRYTPATYGRTTGVIRFSLTQPNIITCSKCVDSLLCFITCCYNLVDMFSQYEMYIIERNAERTASAGRLLYDM